VAFYQNSASFSNSTKNFVLIPVLLVHFLLDEIKICYISRVSLDYEQISIVQRGKPLISMRVLFLDGIDVEA